MNKKTNNNKISYQQPDTPTDNSDLFCSLRSITVPDV